MTEEQPQDPSGDPNPEDNLEEELDDVLSEASALVESLSEEIGTPDDPEQARESPADPENARDSNTAPEDTAQLNAATEAAQTLGEPTTAGPATGSPAAPGAQPKAYSPDRPGLVGTGMLGVVGTPKTEESIQTGETGDAVSLDEAPLTAPQADDTSEPKAPKVRILVPLVAIKILSKVGLKVGEPIVALLELFDRPIQGLGQPIRKALGILALATLSTAVIVFTLSLW